MQPPAELRAALDELDEVARKEGKPNRYHARRVLLALGELLLERPGDAGEPLRRARALGDALGQGWREAAAAELALACAEHVHAVDPRYLDLANYDWEYTLRARERLDQRLEAAEALGLPRPEELLRAVRDADRLLDRHRQGRDT